MQSGIQDNILAHVENIPNIKPKLLNLNNI